MLLADFDYMVGLMCGRYTLTAFQQQLADEFDLVEPDCIRPRYNIAPTQLAPVVCASGVGGSRKLTMCRWGLIPSWAKDLAIGNRMINARSETAAEKPAFRDALNRRRCLVPCSGFYEWKPLVSAVKKPVKQPYYLHRRDEGVLALAGLWDRWLSPDGAETVSFTILTTGPNALMRDLHDRMPVIIPREAYGTWVDSAVSDVGVVVSLMRPWSGDDLVANPVSVRVNNPKFDDPSCIQVVK